MFGTSSKFATSRNHFVTFGRWIFERITLSRSTYWEKMNPRVTKLYELMSRIRHEITFTLSTKMCGLTFLGQNWTPARIIIFSELSSSSSHHEKMQDFRKFHMLSKQGIKNKFYVWHFFLAIKLDKDHRVIKLYVYIIKKGINKLLTNRNYINYSHRWWQFQDVFDVTFVLVKLVKWLTYELLKKDKNSCLAVELKTVYVSQSFL